MVQLDPGQLEAVRNLDSGKILCGGVGTGKSVTSLTYYFTKECQGSIRINGAGRDSPMKTPKDLYIITTARKRETLDWEGEALPFLITKDRKTSISGVTMTVDSWNNIKKYVDIKDAFFIFDEQRLVGSGAWVKAFYKIAKHNRWILLSATPGDTWSDYIPVFVANGFYKNRSEFLDTHAVYKRHSRFPKIDRYIGQTNLDRFKRRLLVPLHYKRDTIPHHRMIGVSHDKAKFDRVLKDRWHIYKEQPIKDVGELHYVMRKVVNADEARARKVLELMERHPKVIVFYNFDYELELLRATLDEMGVTYSEWNGHKHELVPDGDRWAYLVQYTAGAEGWNCITTDTIVFYSLNYSYKLTKQAEGRIDRRNTPFVDLYYYTLRSNSKIDQAIWKALSQKKNFQESNFKWTEKKSEF